MLQSALVLLLGATLVLPHAVDAWPLDGDVIQDVERASHSLRSSVEWALGQAVAYEQQAILEADVVFIGTWEIDGPPAASSWGVCETSRFRTEQCLKGSCGDTVLLHRDSTASRMMWNMPLGARHLDWSPPEAGKRYFFLGRADKEDLSFLYGGFGHERYELSEGFVVGKGVPESEFLDAVRGLLEADTRFRGRPQESEEALVQPSN